MVRKELVELKTALEKEKEVLINKAEEILKWASYKARLTNYLKNNTLTAEEREFLREIAKINERNKILIEASLKLAEEAYGYMNNIIH